MEQRKIHTSVYTSKLCLPLYLTINISICLSTLLNNNYFYTDNLTISWVLLPFPSPHQVKSHIRGRMKSTKQCSISDHFLYFLIKTLTRTAKCRNTLGCLHQCTCKCWDCETVRTMKQSRYINTCRGWRPWNTQACEAVYVHMAPWRLYGGYVFPVVVKLENLNY